MTEKELREQVLFAIYNNQDKLHVDSGEFCNSVGIDIKDEVKRNRIFKDLKDCNFIIGQFSDSGNCYYLQGITSRGVDYVEAPPESTTIPAVVVSGGTGVVVNTGSVKGGIAQNTLVNDAGILKSFASALERLEKSDSFSTDEKEEIIDALNDYKECIEKDETPNRSITRNISKYVNRLLELGEAMSPIIQFAIDHKHIVGL